MLKLGDLVRVRKTAITNWSAKWFIDFAESKTPMLVVEVLDPEHNIVKPLRLDIPDCSYLKLLQPNGSTCFAFPQDLTKRLW